MNHTPRWRHKCPTPSCQKTVFWEYVYCAGCRKADPLKANFRMDRLSSYRKGKRNGTLPTVQETRDHLYAMVRAFALCVECGHKVRLNDLRHRCYFLTDAKARTLRVMRCKVCRFKRAKHLFPRFKRRGKLLRARVCSDCLHDTQLVPVQKRKYHRKPVTV